MPGCAPALLPAAERPQPRRSYATKPAYDEKVEDYLKPVFQSCYTMSFENYPVEAERVHGMEVVDRSTAS